MGLRIVVFIILGPLICLARTPIEHAISWLGSCQDSAGFWSDPVLTTFHTTVFCVTALKDFPQSSENYNSGLNWLKDQGVFSLDYLGFQAQVLGEAGLPIDEKLEILAQAQNPDGGFGLYNHYKSSILDAGIILKPLLKSGNSEIINNGIEFLRENQNFDGGWGLRPNDLSNIYITSLILEFLSHCQQFNVSTMIDTAVGFLRQHQNPDGGFGQDSSTIYETAWAGFALGAVGMGDSVYTRAVNFLINHQSSNGSWNDSPYLTAVSILALKNSGPDLKIETGDIVFIPDQPLEGDTVDIRTLVHNIGTESAQSVLVQFFDGAPDSGGVKIGEVVLELLQADGVDTVDILYPTQSRPGRHFIYALLDPYNQIIENCETNNRALRMLRVIGGPDLELAQEDFIFYPEYPAPGQQVLLQTRVLNGGQQTLYNIKLGFYDGHPDSGGVLIDSFIIPELGSMAYDNADVSVLLSEGAHNVYAIVDPDDEIIEIDESNNQAMNSIGVYNQQDLAVYDWAIFVSNTEPVDGDTITIGASVFNIRENIAVNVRLRFYDGNPDSGGVQIGPDQVIDTILPGEFKTVFYDWHLWYIGGRYHYIHAVVDPDSEIVEIDESNNRASRRIKIIGLPDLTGKPERIWTGTLWNPEIPEDGDTTDVYAFVFNIGSWPIKNQDYADKRVDLYLYHNHPDSGGVLIAEKHNYLPYAGDSAYFFGSWNTSGCAGENKFYLIIDPDDSLGELKEDNNIIFTYLPVDSAPMPDLCIRPDSIEFIPEVPIVGDTVSIIAHIFNLQNRQAEDVVVRFFDEEPETGNLIIEDTIPVVPALGSVATIAQYPTLGKAGFHNIYILIDPEDSIPEKNEENNFAFCELNIRSPLYMSPKNLVADTINRDEVRITWQPPDSETIGYRLYRNGVLLNYPRNFAPQGTARASCSAPNYPPERAIDSDNYSYWLSDYDPQSPLWWSDSFSQVIPIHCITIYWYRVPHYFEVQAWKNGGWQTVDAESLTSGYHIITIHRFPDLIYTDRIRINMPDVSGYYCLGIYECYIYHFNLITDTTFVDTFLGRGIYTYYATAFDSSVAESPPSNSDTVIKGDFTAPSAPTNLQANVYHTNMVQLSWTAPPDSDRFGYRLYRDGNSLLSDTTQIAHLESNPPYEDYDNLVDDIINLPGGIMGLHRKILYFSRFITEPQHDFLFAYNTDVAQEYEAFSGRYDSLQVFLPPDQRRLRFYTDYAGTFSGWSIDSIRYFFDYNSTVYYDYVYENGTHTYEVTAIDSFGNEGPPATVQIVISDTSAPARPESLRVFPGNHCAHLTWKKNNDKDLAGYNIYRLDTLGPVNGSTPYPDTTYTDTGLIDQNIYSYYLTAVDINGFESVPSETVSVIISTIDLLVRDEEIYLYPSHPKIGLPITIQPRVYNIGWADCDSALIRYYDGSPDSGGVLIGIDTISVPQSTAQFSQIEWQGSIGTHNIWIVANPLGYYDCDTTNNIAHRKIEIYPEDARIVMFDDAHLPACTADSSNPTTFWDPCYTGGYAVFASLLRDAGFYTTTLCPGEEFNQYTLKNIDALIIHAPSLAHWDNPPSPAFTDEEIDVISDWVKDGGGLFLISDNLFYELRLQKLAQKFGVSFQGTNLHSDETPAQHYPPDAHFVGFLDSLHFKDHPVLQNINSLYINWTNAIFKMPKNAVPVVVSDSGMAPDNIPIMVAIQEDPVHKNSVTGRGRVFIACDINSFDNVEIDPYVGDTTYRIYKGEDERFVVNVVNWLTEARNDTLPDLAISPAGVEIQDSILVLGRVSKINITLFNYGNTTAPEFHFSFARGNPDSGGKIILDTVLSQLPLLDSLSFELTWRPEESGQYELYFLIDHNDSIQELSESNNLVVADVEVLEPSLPDLVLSQIRVEPNPIHQGELVSISGVVYNYGALVNGCDVAFYKGDPDSGGVYLGSSTIGHPLAPFDSSAVELSNVPISMSGVFRIFGVGDPNNNIEEENENNNRDSTYLEVFTAPLSVSLSLDDTVYNANSDIQIQTVINNLGLSLWNGDLIVQIEDSSGNICDVVDTILVSGLAAPFADWHFMIPIKVKPAYAPIQDGLASVRVNFSQILAGLGYEGTHLDTNSIRVVEFERSGGSIQERSAGLYYHPDSLSVVVWKLDGFTYLNRYRYFVLYFDIMENGQKPPPANRLPPDLIVAIDYRNYLYRFCSYGNGSFERLGVIDTLHPWWQQTYPLEISLADFDLDQHPDLILPRDYNIKTKLYLFSAIDTITGNDSLMIKGNSLEAGIAQELRDYSSYLLNSCLEQDSTPAKSFSISCRDSLPPFIKRIGKFWGIHPQSFQYNPDQRNFACADFNNDGLPDVLVVSGGCLTVGQIIYYQLKYGYLFLFINNGDGTFERFQIPVVDDMPVSGADVADFNRDGIADIVIAALYDDYDIAVYISFGLGDCRFSSWKKTDIEFNCWGNYKKMVADDFDNDGVIDLILKNPVCPYDVLMIYKGIDDTTFAEPEEIQLNPTPIANKIAWFDHYDYNYDGNSDLVAFALVPEQDYNKLYFYPGNGDGTFGTGSLLDSINLFMGYTGYNLTTPPWYPRSLSEMGTPQEITDSMVVNLTWNTGSTPSGRYWVHALTTEYGGIVAEDTAGFKILASSAIVARVQTDKPSYNAQEDVNIVAEVINQSQNFVYYSLAESIFILTPGPETLFVGARMIEQLQIGEHSSAEYQWNTATYLPDTYSVYSKISDSTGTIISQDLCDFEIRPANGYDMKLAGEINAVPRNVSYPQNFDINFSVQNIGNIDLDTLILKAVINVPENQSTVYLRLDTVQLNVGETYQFDSTFASTDFGLGNYLLGLYAVLPDSDLVISVAGFRITDATPPLIVALGPEGYVSGDVTLSAEVCDSISGVASVYYCLDTLDYQIMPRVGGDSVYGIYQEVWSTTPQDDGLHWLRVKAEDYYGNQVLDSISFIVDNTAPAPPILVSPPDSSTILADTATIIGSAEPNSMVKLWLNQVNYTTQTTAGGTFTIPGAEFEPGWNQLKFTATDPLGNESDTSYYGIYCDLGPILDLTRTSEFIPRILVWYSRPEELQFIKGIFDTLRVYYYATDNHPEFEREFRSQKFNYYIIFPDYTTGDDNIVHAGPEPGPDTSSYRYRFSQEIKEAIFRGAGLISVRWPIDWSVYWDSLCIDDINLIVGARAETLIQNIEPFVYLDSSGISLPDTLSIIDTAGLFLDITTAEPVGWFLKGSTSFPGVTINKYGYGHSILFNFDLVGSIDSTNLLRYQQLLLSCIDYLQPDPVRYSPYNCFELGVQIENNGPQYRLNLTQLIPDYIQIVEPLDSGFVSGPNVSWNFILPDSAWKRFSVIMRFLDIAQVFDFIAELKYLRDGVYHLYKDYSFNLILGNSTRDLIDRSIEGLDTLSLPSNEEVYKRLAIDALYRMRSRIVQSPEDLISNIKDAISVTDCIMEIQSVDLSMIRRIVDDILSIWEARWYLW